MNSDSGNRDWLNDYAALKRVNQSNPYAVPIDYFSELEQRTVSFIKLDELKKTGLPQGFTVPENYFEELADNLQSRIAIEDELNKQPAAFGVPKDYFNNLEQQIKSRIFVEEALNRQLLGLTLPENYFDNLQQQLNSRIFVEHELARQPTAFAVPDGYFGRLSESILNKTVSKDPVKRSGVVRQLFSSVAFKYATAACFTLVVGAALLLSPNSDPNAEHDKTYLHKSLSVVSVADIKSYLQLHLDESDNKELIDNGKQINSDKLNSDLKDYLDNTQ